MYNGIGLLTARGSGTSGYVQTNKFNLRGGPPQTAHSRQEVDRNAGPAVKQPNQDILEHNRRREIEVKLYEYEAELEDQGCRSHAHPYGRRNWSASVSWCRCCRGRRSAACLC